MKDHLFINGNKIELTEEQSKKIMESFGIRDKKLAEFEVGEVFKVGKYEFIVLEQGEGCTCAIMKDLLFKSMEFGENNNYNGSKVDNALNKFAEELEAIVGRGNLILHEVDLTSDDGLKDYGAVMRRASLLTTEEYSKYVYILDKYKIDDYWWLATPWSTPTHNDKSGVKCVSPAGRIGSVYGGDYGVRPFCIFNSSIFGSCVK